MSEYPQFKIANNCRHWDAEKNKRFSLYRVDRLDDGMNPVGAVWDPEERVWLDGPFVMANVTFKRDATPKEIASAQELI